MPAPYFNLIVSRLHWRRGAKVNNRERNALSLWRLLCLLMLLSLLGVMLWSSALYRRIERNEFVSMKTKDAAEVSLDRQKLQETIGLLDAKKARFDKLLSGG